MLLAFWDMEIGIEGAYGGEFVRDAASSGGLARHQQLFKECTMRKFSN